MFYVYALQSLSRNYLYVGMTNSLPRRIRQHQLGQNKTTKPYLPFKLVFQQEFSTREGAREKEIYLKSGVGKQFLKSLNNK
jgi:putative endonuclease